MLVAQLNDELLVFIYKNLQLLIFLQKSLIDLATKTLFGSKTRLRAEFLVSKAPAPFCHNAYRSPVYIPPPHCRTLALYCHNAFYSSVYLSPPHCRTLAPPSCLPAPTPTLNPLCCLLWRGSCWETPSWLYSVCIRQLLLLSLSLLSMVLSYSFRWRLHLYSQE